MTENILSILPHILSIVCGIFIYLIFRFVIFKKYIMRLSEDMIKVINYLRFPLFFLLPLLLLPFFRTLLLHENSYESLGNWYQSFVIICSAWLLISLSEVFRLYMLRKYTMEKLDNIKERKIHTQLLFMKRIVTILIVIVSISLLLMNYPPARKLGAGLLTSAGIAGLIIGFAAQKSLANLLAGFQIAFTQPIRIDDVVVVEGEWGKIEEINLTYVVVRIWDQRRLVLPINYFIEKPFQNWTRTTADIWGTVFLFVDYTVPVAALREKFEEVLASNPLWDGKIKAVQVTDTTEKTIEIRFLMSARNSPDAFDLRCIVREEMVAFVQSNYPESLPKIRFEGREENL
jgi:small-conductance mechanosensitive channel